MQPHHYLGLDLGQDGQLTACAVLEKAPTEEPEPVYALRYLQRFGLEMSFNAIVHQVSRVVAMLPSEVDYPTLVVDQTGVGRPVLELFRRTPMRASIIPVCITAGQQASTSEDGTRLVPKIELVSCLQILLQGRRLQVARGLPAAQILTRELQNFRMKVTPAAGDVGVWRENQHDDLVFAVGLACWMAEREPAWGPDALACGGTSLMANPPEGMFLNEDWPGW